MADKRITELNLHTSPQLSDVLPIVNSGETKKTTYGSLYYGIRDGLVSGSGQIILDNVTNFTSYSSSVESKITSLNNFTSSQEDFNDTVMITGSLVGSALRFEKGDSSTFDIELGTDFVQVSYLSCYSTSSQQLIASGAAQAVTFNSIWAENGVHIVSGSQITFDEAAAYEFKFVAKVENSDNAVHDVWFWVKYNGENFPNSATRMTLQPRKNSEESSSQLMTVSITGVAQNDNDYIQLYWTGESTLTSLHASPGNGIIPSSPSIIASIIRV